MLCVHKRQALQGKVDRTEPNLDRHRAVIDALQVCFQQITAVQN